jgi:hypothetical protein
LIQVPSGLQANLLPSWRPSGQPRPKPWAGRMAIERAAEALDAEIAAIVCVDRVVAVVRYPGGAVPVRELTLITAEGAHHKLTVPYVGACWLAAVSLDYPPGATFILARAGPDADLRHDRGQPAPGHGASHVDGDADSVHPR